MKLSILRALALLCLPFATQAQTPITNTSFSPVVGDVFTNYQCDTAGGISPGSSGASTAWDFSSLVVLDTNSFGYLNCAATPFCSLFPGSTATLYAVAYSATPTDTIRDTTYEYYNSTDTAFKLMGYCHVGDTTTFLTGYNIHFPFNYNDYQQDTIYGIRNSEFAGLGIHERIFQTLHYDASGTLILPTGTYTNVWRLHRSTIFQDSLIYSTSFVTIDSSDTYEWYIAGYHNPLLSIGMQGGAITGITYSAPATEGISIISTKSTPIKVYSVPAHNELYVQYTQVVNEAAQICLLDMSGKVLLRNTGKDSPGNYTVNVNVSDLAPGLYLLSIHTGQETIVKKVTIE